MKLGLIGYPVGHSLSPLMHRQWLEAAGIKGQYDAVSCAPSDLENFVNSVKKASENDTVRGFNGLNVTIPHKEFILPLMDKLAPQARKIGAVNTVKFEKGLATGFNTDGLGFLSPLRARSHSLNKPVLLIGAGGAARAILAALLTTETPLVMIHNRTLEKAQILAQQLGSGRATIIDSKDLSDAVAAAGLIVNSSSLGMEGQPPLGLDLTPAGKGTIVYDIVYKPLLTPLLAQAKALGLPYIDGLDMLIGQGAASFKIWTGVSPDTYMMKEKLVMGVHSPVGKPS